MGALCPECEKIDCLEAAEASNKPEKQSVVQPPAAYDPDGKYFSHAQSPRNPNRIPESLDSQAALYALFKEYSLNHTRDPSAI